MNEETDKFEILITKNLQDLYGKYIDLSLEASEILPDNPDLKWVFQKQFAYNIILKVLSELIILRNEEEFFDIVCSLQMQLTADIFRIYEDTHEIRYQEAKEIIKKHLEE